MTFVDLDREVTERHDLAGSADSTLLATKLRSHSRHQLAIVERLRDVVVRAELEPSDHIVAVLLRCDHDDGDAARAAELPADLEPAETW